MPKGPTCFILNILLLAVAIQAADREKLLIDVIEMDLNVTNFALEQSASIASSLLQDKSIGDELKAPLSSYVREVADAQRQPTTSETNAVNRFLRLVAKSVIFAQFEAIVGQQNDTSSKANSARVASVRAQYGVAQFEQELEQRRLAFLRTFQQLVANYIDTLSTQQKQDNASLLNWYRKYKDTSDTRRINEMLSEFLKLA